MAGAIPYSRAPKLTPEMEKQTELEQALYKKEITMEEAVKQGYKPDETILGMSDLRVYDQPNE